MPEALEVSCCFDSWSAEERVLLVRVLKGVFYTIEDVASWSESGPGAAVSVSALRTLASIIAGRYGSTLS